MDLLFGTTNPGKLRELRRLVAGTPIRVVSPADLGRALPEVEEDGRTFEENARKKAVAHARASGLHALADDSGLCVDALGGRPGVHSARYAEGGDRARYEKLLRELEGVEPSKRTAAFRCALCLAVPGREPIVEFGECPGVIGEAPRGEHGFGFDPVFYLPELGRTMAELTRDEKGRLSHRGRAFEKMRPHLAKLAAPSGP